MATTYGARLNFRDTSAASCKGLVHGSCWPDAEEPGSKHDLEGKGANREMATSGFTYRKCIAGIRLMPCHRPGAWWRVVCTDLRSLAP